MVKVITHKEVTRREVTRREAIDKVQTGVRQITIAIAATEDMLTQVVAMISATATRIEAGIHVTTVTEAIMDAASPIDTAVRTATADGARATTAPEIVIVIVIAVTVATITAAMATAVTEVSVARSEAHNDTVVAAIMVPTGNCWVFTPGDLRGQFGGRNT
jgi:uncharacterized membrane protein